MVLRPSSLPQSPIISRGHSPLRNGTTYRKTPSPNTNSVMPGSKVPTRSSSMNNGFRGISPSRSINGLSRGRSPQKNAPILIRSRENEKGSIDNIASRSIGNGSNPSTPDDNINVVIRVRPLNNKEIRSGDEMVTQFPGHGQILCDISATPGSSSVNGQKAKLFSYNVVFEPGANQEDVLQYSGIKRLIEMAIEGFCCTAFCYGQTGSGKTHTLTGPPELFHGHKPNLTDERHGLIFRSFIYLFKLLQERKDVNFILKASFLEIYNEKVIDLLNPGSARKPLAVRWSKKSRSFFVENLFTVDCEELDDLLAVLEEGMRNRSVGSHAMNDYSSRSHTILTVHITSEQQAEGGVFISKQGKINFVDLAGSEMTKKTHSEGKTLEEANNINKSLMVLGYCIASLSDSKKRNGHIPYRDSKLTKLLADSLAGNGVTLMIACISPARSNETETVNTLRYAARAKKIRTKPIIVMDPREALILSLKREIGILHQENDHLRAVLQLNSSPIPTSITQTPNSEVHTPNPFGEDPGKRIIPEAPKLELEKIAELDGSELAELVKLYMVENRALRTENSELSSTRDMVLRDHEIVCRENERLLKKLEDVNSVCCRSPLIPARPTFSAEMLNMSTGSETDSNVWTNPMAVSMDSSFNKDKDNDPLGERILADGIPDSIQKELEKRKIGENLTSNNFRRHNSWENSRSSSGGSQSNRSRKDSASDDKNHLSPSQQFVDESKLKKSSSHTSLASGRHDELASIPPTRPSSTLSQTGRQRTLTQFNRNRRQRKIDVFGSIVSLNEF